MSSASRAEQSAARIWEWAKLPRAICGHIQTQQGVINMSNTDPIGWRGVVYGTPVASIDGVRVGTIREVLGSDSEDISTDSALGSPQVIGT
jgi:hypothetical protein